MLNHIIILTLVAVTFVSCRRMPVRQWLMAWGIIALPLSYDFSVVQLVSVDQFHGWTPGMVLRLSDLFMVMFLLGDWARPGGCRLRHLFGFGAFRWFVLAACLSVVFASHRNYALVATVEIVKDCVLYGYAPARFLRDGKSLDYLLHLLGIALMLQGVLGILQFICQDYYTVLRTGGEGTRTLFDNLIRSEGTLGQPNSYAGYLVPVMLLLLSAALASQGGMRKRYLLSVGAGGLGLLFSLSRSGWLAFMAGIVLLSFHPAMRLSRGATMRVMFLLVVGGLAVAWPLVKTRITGDDQGAAEDRYWLAKHAWEIIRHNYLTGVGINNYRFAMYEYLPAGYDWNFIYRVHNLFLLVFAEMGILGLMAITMLFVRPVLFCLHHLSRVTPKEAMLGVGTGVALVAMVIQNISDTGWSVAPLRSLFFILLAIVTYLKSQQLAERPAANES